MRYSVALGNSKVGNLQGLEANACQHLVRPSWVNGVSATVNPRYNELGYNEYRDITNENRCLINLPYKIR